MRMGEFRAMAKLCALVQVHEADVRRRRIGVLERILRRTQIQYQNLSVDILVVVNPNTAALEVKIRYRTFLGSADKGPRGMAWHGMA